MDNESNYSSFSYQNPIIIFIPVTEIARGDLYTTKKIILSY